MLLVHSRILPYMATKYFPKWLQNQLISTGIEPVLSHNEKSCTTSYYKQFYTNIKLKISKSIPVLLAMDFSSFAFNLIFFILISAESWLYYYNYFQLWKICWNDGTLKTLYCQLRYVKPSIASMGNVLTRMTMVQKCPAIVKGGFLQ